MRAFAFFFVLAAVLFAGPAAASVCGNGYCEVGEDAGNCAQDCQCFNTASIDYALCCCCQNDPAPQGECTPKAICNYPEIGGCCCLQFDPLDPLTCLFCVEKDEIPGWCSGGIGAWEGNGTCGGSPTVPSCEDTELTDDYVDGVNVRTRCATTTVPLGVVEGGGDGFAIEVSVVYNEGRPPPAEIGADFPNAQTGPYGKGGWLSVDKIFTDEGVYWKSTDAGKVSPTGVIAGQRGDRNGNGYVGYTLHDPFGSRTYDYPVVLKVHGYDQPVGVFRSEPFDGKFLIVEDPKGPDTGQRARKYTLFRYPNGPFEIYDWQLSNPIHPSPFDKSDPVRAASLLSEIDTRYGPPDSGGGHRWIKVWRGAQGSNAADYITGPPFTKWDLKFDYAVNQPDGGTIVKAARSPGKLVVSLAMTQKFDFRPETFTTPGRQSEDLTTFEWDEWRIKSVRLQIRDQAQAPVYEATAQMQREADNLKIVASVQSSKLLGMSEGEEMTRFEPCDISGAAFSGTTISMPYDMRMSFEYGDETVQHRLVAQTHATGGRTQYRFNDVQTEPRGELVDAVSVAGPTPPEMLATGFGTHIDWDMIEQLPLNPSLFPPGTFVGPASSKGVPVTKQLSRLPDGLVLRTLSNWDPNVLLPRRIADERGLVHALSYYADTGQLESYKKQGVTRRYVRTIQKNVLPPGSSSFIDIQSIETWLEGAGGKKAFLGKTSWNLKTGRFYGQVEHALQLDPSAPTSGAVKPMKIEKKMTRDIYDAPTRVQTLIDGILVGETTVGWDPRFMGPAQAKTTINGKTVASAAPMGGAGVDGFGDMVGNWQVAGPGEQLTMFAKLDPLGNVEAATTNGVGDKRVQSAGPDAQTSKTTIFRLSPSGEIPELEELETAGTTAPVCQ